MTPLLLSRIIAVLLFMAPGFIATGAAVMGSRWFFESRSASAARRWFGERGTRLFYGLLGLFLIASGLMILFDPRGLLP